MKFYLRTLLVVLMILVTVKVSIAFDNIIYVAELIIDKDIETAKTLIHIIRPDGTELKKVLVSGVMARVSPDGKNVVYLEQKTIGPWEVVLADAEGKKIKYLPLYGKHPKGVLLPQPTNLIWSPDGEKIAIVSGIQEFISIAVHNLKTNVVKAVYTGRTGSSEEAYFYKANWFSDSKRLLIAGSDGTRIIDTETKEETVISNQSVGAYITSDSKKIFYVPQLNKIHLDAGLFKPPFELYQYDTAKRKSELLMTLDIAPQMAILSADGRYLVIQSMPITEASIFVADLLKKKLIKVDTKAFFLLPKKFSPSANDLVICLGSERNESIPQYGILNLNNGEFKVLKKSTTAGLEGERSLIMFMGFDWYDWR